MMTQENDLPDDQQPEVKVAKLFVDDIRNPPDDTWIIARTADEAIDLLTTHRFDVLSIDQDISADKVNTGFRVAAWIDEQTFLGCWDHVPNQIEVHSVNPAGIKYLQGTIASIDRMFAGRSIPSDDGPLTDGQLAAIRDDVLRTHGEARLIQSLFAETEINRRPESYRVQDACINCKHVFIKTAYEESDELYCTNGAPTRPLCMSVHMRETLPWKVEDAIADAAYSAWDEWRTGREVQPNGICLEYGRQD